VHLSRCGDPGNIHGEAKLVGVQKLSLQDFLLPKHVKKHCVKDMSIVKKYAKIWAWELKYAKKHRYRFRYEAQQGPVKWESC